MSFKGKAAKALFDGEDVKAFRAYAKVASRKLDMLDAAVALEDLRSPPGNHLEALKGNRKGQHSIRINDQYRICFIWNDGAEQVEIVDYHWTKEGLIMPRISTRPGEILAEEFLKPLDITPHALALALRVPSSRIAGILNEKNPRAITADTALRLGRFFATSAQFWLNL